MMHPTLGKLGIDLVVMLGFPNHSVYPHHTYSYPLYTITPTPRDGFFIPKKARFTDWVLPVLLASSKQPVYVVTNGYVQIGTT